MLFINVIVENILVLFNMSLNGLIVFIIMTIKLLKILNIYLSLVIKLQTFDLWLQSF